MTIRHMRIFAEVCQTENITKAAENLYMTQPAVSRAVRELEEYYGVKLFERMNRRLYVTECGKNLYRHVIPILDLYDQTEQELKDWDRFGKLRAGASISIGNFLLPELAASFREIYPDIRLQVSISNSHDVQMALLQNSLDVGLIEGVVTEEDLHAEVFQQDRLLLIAGRDHPLRNKESVKLADLEEYNLLLREKGSAGRDFLDHVFAVRGLPLSPLWESTSTQALIRAVQMGIGISVLPEMLVRDAIDRGEVYSCSIEDEPFVRDNFLVWHKDKYLSKALQDFIRLCREKGLKINAEEH